MKDDYIILLSPSSLRDNTLGTHNGRACKHRRLPVAGRHCRVDARETQIDKLKHAPKQAQPCIFSSLFPFEQMKHAFAFAFTTTYMTHQNKHQQPTTGKASAMPSANECLQFFLTARLCDSPSIASLPSNAMRSVLNISCAAWVFIVSWKGKKSLQGMRQIITRIARA